MKFEMIFLPERSVPQLQKNCNLVNFLCKNRSKINRYWNELFLQNNIGTNLLKSLLFKKRF